MLNSVIKDYHIQRELGRGGMATVHLAHDQKFDTNVAIKVLNKEFAYNENIRKRFVSEAKSMFKMSHPNIIKVNDLIEENDTVAFVMEYIEGETLKEYIDRKGKLKHDEFKTIFSQMLDAVGYVHKQNLVHRDIKPSNFMIDREGKVKLMDFGIAKTLDASSSEYTQTGTGAQMGTPMYMSPEQITESKSVTAQSDIYSLGVVLWQMVTGQKPYDTKTLSNFQLQIKIVQEELPHTNTVWDSIIVKATFKNTENRYSTCNEFSNELSSVNGNMCSDDNEITIVSSHERNESTIVEQKEKVDDYMTKTISVGELLDRKNAILSLTSALPEDGAEVNEYAIGRYHFDCINQKLAVDTKEFKLTTNENELLRLLCKNTDSVMERSYALKAIWGDDNFFNGRSMEVCIAKLRKYLKEDPSIEILNIQGRGFKLEGA